MILVDTNVFVDVWSRDPVWADWSERTLARAAEAGPLGINPIVYAELCLGFEEESQLDETLAEAGIRRSVLSAIPFRIDGRTWRRARVRVTERNARAS